MPAEAYRREMAGAWNALNAEAVNGHFLFDRDFMDYHSDRFLDASMVTVAGEELIALLPLNRVGDAAFSHQGLSFGGLIHQGLGTSQVMQALDDSADRLRGTGVRTLTYKALPWIYARAPAQQDLYWLFQKGAELVRRDVSAAIDYRNRGRVSSRRRRGAARARKAGVLCAETGDWRGYWRLLERVLAERHGARPVHSLDEMQRLAGRFPEQIRLHLALQGSDLVAGVVIFASPEVAHAQYIAAGEVGRELGALDALFEHLIDLYAGSRRYFDFGISNTNEGRLLNEGLIRQKEEFGASALVHDTYRVRL